MAGARVCSHTADGLVVVGATQERVYSEPITGGDGGGDIQNLHLCCVDADGG